VTLESVAAYTTAATLVIAPLAFGGVFAWSVLVIATASVISAGLTIAAYARSEIGKATSPFLLALVLVVVFTAVQALPLPIDWLGWLSRGSYDAHRGAAELVAGGASTGTLSYDPGATHTKIVEWSAIAAIFVAAWFHSAAGKGRLVRTAVCVSVLTVAGVTFAHFLFTLDRVYGVYLPVYASHRLIGPIINENNLGGFLLLGPFLMIGLAQDSSREKRVFWYVGAALVIAMAMLSLSRGAVLGLAVGATLTAAAQVRRRLAGNRGRALAAVAVVVGAGVSVGLYVGAGRLLDALGRQGFEKLAIIWKGAELASEHALFGVGRGGFSAAFAAEHGTKARFEHAENWLVDGAAEWGTPVMVAFVSTAAFALWRRRSNARSNAGLGTLAALAAFSTHALVDFAFEMVGIAIPLFALLATLLAPRTAPVPIRAGAALSSATLGRVALAIAIAALAGLGWLLPVEETSSLRATLEQRYQEGDREGFRTTLDLALRAHPAEPVFPLLAATESLHYDDPTTARWLNRAMQLAPHWSSPHALAARWLERRGRLGQAAIELREAASRDPLQTHAAACRFLVRHPDPGLARAVVPRDEAAPVFLERLARCNGLSQELQASIDEQLTRRDPSTIAPIVRAARRDREAGRLDAALANVARALERDPVHAEALVLRATILESRGEGDRAIAELAQAAGRSPEPEPLIRMRAEILARARRSEEMRRALDELRALAGSRPSELAEFEAYVARLESQCGNNGRAMGAYEDAYELDPKPEYLVQIARIAEQIGDLGTALSAYTRLRAIDPQNARYGRALERVERRIRESSL
jgi:tetratricopeptide (TPR) repeat protein